VSYFALFSAGGYRHGGISLSLFFFYRVDKLYLSVFLLLFSCFLWGLVFYPRIPVPCPCSSCFFFLYCVVLMKSFDVRCCCAETGRVVFFFFFFFWSRDFFFLVFLLLNAQEQ
jgi:hypothetical protein